MARSWASEGCVGKELSQEKEGMRVSEELGREGQGKGREGKGPGEKMSWPALGVGKG